MQIGSLALQKSFVHLRIIDGMQRLYTHEPAFYELDDSSEGFEYLDDSTGSYTVDPGEKSSLIKRTCRAIVSAFWSDDAKKLTSILLDWAKHTDEKQVKDALYALLRECELEGDAGYLKKVLSNFFLALTDPWKTRASAIMDIQYRRAFKARHQG